MSRWFYRCMVPIDIALWAFSIFEAFHHLKAETWILWIAAMCVFSRELTADSKKAFQ